MTKTESIGFLNIDKPENWTSHDVVAKARKLLGIRRIGHSGTLDPFATGVLPLAVGPATRLIRFLPKSKKYRAEINLKFTTDTDDLTGLKLRDTDKNESETVFKARLEKFKGTIDQIPPLYSAKKINGKKLYELMREGQALDLTELEPKKVTIKEITLLSFNYPLAIFEVACSEGTYIRSIARDLGGHLTMLRRLESIGFDIKSCVRFEDLQDGDLDIEDLLLDIKDYLNFPKIRFNAKTVVALQQGQAIFLEDNILNNIFPDNTFQDNTQDNIDNSHIICLDDSEELIGIASILNKDDFGSKNQNLKAQPVIIF
jgi:tRNA pseudouridine55 synthase